MFGTAKEQAQSAFTTAAADTATIVATVCMSIPVTFVCHLKASIFASRQLVKPLDALSSQRYAA